MEFPFIIRKEFSIDNENFLILNGSKMSSKIKPPSSLLKLINEMGEASSIVIKNSIIINSLKKAQDLKAVITTYDRFLSSEARLYMKVEDNKALGFIKVGPKNLFYRDLVGNIKQITPLCVLDFYVHESVQRCGIGKVNKN